MRYAPLSHVGDQVARIVLGSLVFDVEAMDLVRTLMDEYVARGGTIVDTAHVYRAGRSEQALGQWLRERGGRERLSIITKGAHHAPDGTRRVRPEVIEAELTVSLERLGVDYVDLYLLHRDDSAVPVGPIVECLNAQLAAGRIRAFGGSNWSAARLDEANEYAWRRGLRGFTASSPNLALAVPSEPMWTEVIYATGDAAELAWYRERQMPLLAWSSQASGFFSGRFTPEDRSDEVVARVYYTEGNWERLRRARELARRLGATPTQVALAWVLHQPFPTFALVGPNTLAELRDCLGAADIDLSPAEAAWLNLERRRRPRAKEVGARGPSRNAT